MADFHLSITEWYRQNKRDLPWRETTSPYPIWLSEIILQQTRVEQGKSYYNKFLDHYPTLEDLAKADEQDVLNDWQGLGYYSRARNLHHTAKILVLENKGQFPRSYAELLKLKGIGKYTAAAIASFAYNEAVPVVDGNVYRVLSRHFNIDISIDSSAGQKLFFELAGSLMKDSDPGEFNQAIMEFGALQCTPSNPNCPECPLQITCEAYAKGTIPFRPVKKSKTKVRNRYFHFLIFQMEGKTILEKREHKDIWQSLFQFPLIETENSISPDWNQHFGIEPLESSEVITHLLSHQKIHARFYHFASFPESTQEPWKVIKTSEIQNYPLPRLIDRYLEEHYPFN